MPGQSFPRANPARFAVLFLALAALLLSGCAKNASRATVFYTTDTHGRLSADASGVGLDVIAAAHKETSGSLLVDAGDYLQGNPSVNLTQGKDAVRLMKMAGYYAAALGNHEFDFGLEALRERMAEAAAGPDPLYIISANVLNADGSLFTRPAATTEAGGLKIGFLGLTTEETATQTHPHNVAGLVFADVAQRAGDMAKKLRAEGCDVVVALAHVGTADVLGVKSTDIAMRVDGIDVIIDGHSHVELNETMPNGTLVISSGAHAKALGRLVLTRQGAPGSGLRKDNTLLRKAELADITPDPAVAGALARMKEEQAALLARVVGATPVDLDAERVNIRTRETNFGNLCTDALRHMTGADVAIINGGGIRRSIAKGEITKGDVIAAIPFADAVVTKNVTGAQLLVILEHGFRGLPAENGGFPQLSGLRVTVNTADPPGKRVASVRLDNGETLDPRRNYTLAVSDFLASGGDGYPVLATLPALRQYLPPDTALEAYLRDMGRKAFEGIHTERVTIRPGSGASLRLVWPARDTELASTRFARKLLAASPGVGLSITPQFQGPFRTAA